MNRFLSLGVVVAFSGLLWTTSALAISLDLVPSSPTVMEGDSADVAVIISGLVAGRPPSVGAFDLTVSFDPAILSPTSVTFGPFLGNPNLFEALTDFKFSGGSVELAEVSLLSPTALDALQPASFTLATLSFSALTSGTTPLALSQIRVDDAFGNTLIPVTEPHTLLLLGSSLAGLAGLTWSRQRIARKIPERMRKIRDRRHLK